MSRTFFGPTSCIVTGVHVCDGCGRKFKHLLRGPSIVIWVGDQKISKCGSCVKE